MRVNGITRSPNQLLQFYAEYWKVNTATMSEGCTLKIEERIQLNSLIITLDYSNCTAKLCLFLRSNKVITYNYLEGNHTLGQESFYN